MSEPRNRSKSVSEVTSGILHWTVHDDRIRFRSDAHALREAGRCVLIDPLPLQRREFEKLGSVEAICLTGSCHQRSAWRYRKHSGARVYAPEGAKGLEEAPDVWYREAERLPAGLLAVHAPGPTEVHYGFLLERAGGVLFCADVVIEADGELSFVPDEYMDEPQRTRETARKLLDLEFEILCFDHGAPMTRGAKEAVQRLLSREDHP